MCENQFVVRTLQNLLSSVEISKICWLVTTEIAQLSKPEKLASVVVVVAVIIVVRFGRINFRSYIFGP